MKWLGVFGLGVVAWLIPFVVAVIAFPLHANQRPLFESIMAVAVTATAVILGLTYLRKHQHAGIRHGLVAGVVWMAVCLLIDAPLMLLEGPMQMSPWAYLSDIGLTYLVIPIVTTGLAANGPLTSGKEGE